MEEEKIIEFLKENLKVELNSYREVKVSGDIYAITEVSLILKDEVISHSQESILIGEKQ